MAPVCFVVMGFGKKIDLATGRELDLDKTYQNVIKPAVTDAGYACERADEILHSGIIDVPMYDRLFGAELVVADLSTANLNAIFELGVRHAMKPRTTIIIAESKFKIPFDASHIVVYAYEHLGPDIGFSETMRMRGLLTNLANALRTSQQADSPVYVALSNLQPPSLPAPARAAAFAAAAEQQAAPVDTYAVKLQIARDAMAHGDFSVAKSVLRGLYDEQTATGADGAPKPARPFVVQQLALATYKAAEADAKTAGPDTALVGYTEAEQLLRTLNIDATTDPETLGLWSAIHKRRAEMSTQLASQRLDDAEEAVHAAERGFMIKRDYYNGTNLAYLFNLRASLSSGDDRIADNVFASRVRRMLLKITADRLAALVAEQLSAVDANAPPPASDSGEVRPLAEERYWVEATHAECLIALDDPTGEDLMKKALASAPAAWMAATTQDQLDRVKALLAKAGA
jgi:hypothetical protein